MMLAEDDGVDSIWLAYKWEGLRPLNMFMDGGPPKPKGGFLKSKCVCSGGGLRSRGLGIWGLHPCLRYVVAVLMKVPDCLRMQGQLTPKGDDRSGQRQVGGGESIRTLPSMGCVMGDDG